MDSSLTFHLRLVWEQCGSSHKKMVVFVRTTYHTHILPQIKYAPLYSLLIYSAGFFVYYASALIYASTPPVPPHTCSCAVLLCFRAPLVIIFLTQPPPLLTPEREFTGARRSLSVIHPPPTQSSGWYNGCSGNKNGSMSCGGCCIIVGYSTFGSGKKVG